MELKENITLLCTLGNTKQILSYVWNIYKFFKCKGRLCEEIKDKPAFKIFKPSPLPINIFYDPLYFYLPTKLVACGVQ